ncbi:MAG: hypothetical protein J1E81_07565 [Eubacterium sp.]|nr:hypothetical protein [Eubacterium sp.]
MKIHSVDGLCLSCRHRIEGDCKQTELDIWRDDLTKVVADCDDYEKTEVKNEN